MSASVQPTPDLFDVNDLSYLWPVPRSDEDLKHLISAEDAAADGKRIWPLAVFKTLLDTAQGITVQGSASEARIRFDPAEEFVKPSTWKLVSFRVDPSAPGTHAGALQRFGSTPQLRIIFQPVTKVGEDVKVHDVAAHLAFSYVVPPTGPSPFPATPNRAVFAKLVAALKGLRDASKTGGAPTGGPLRVHPGLEKRVPGFEAKVRAFLQEQTALGELNELAFMGIDPPEPWIFFSMRRNPQTGAYTLISPPSLNGRSAQMLFMLDPARVVPSPTTANMESEGGVSTARLLLNDAPQIITRPVFSGPRPTHGDIPDIIANPTRATVFNTDCVSCHTESTRRTKLNLGATDSMFKYARPDGISTVDPAMLPTTPWNTRNFGWFKTSPTITMRAANETAEATHFTNREYLTGVPPGLPAAAPAQKPVERSVPMPTPVASPLTLVMDIKSPGDFVALKAKIDQMQGLPPDQNPIIRALTELKTVHFARFVFLNEKQLAVITTYDGSFEDYIDSFVDKIGGVFDEILKHVADPPPTSVKLPQNRKAFLAYVKKHDLTAIPPFYSAYPNLGVLDILALQKKAGGGQ